MTSIEDFTMKRTFKRITQEICGMSEEERIDYLSNVVTTTLNMLGNEHYPEEFLREKGFYKEEKLK